MKTKHGSGMFVIQLKSYYEQFGRGKCTIMNHLRFNFKPESKALLGAIAPKSAPRKSVDLDHCFFLKSATTDFIIIMLVFMKALFMRNLNMVSCVRLFCCFAVVVWMVCYHIGMFYGE